MRNSYDMKTRKLVKDPSNLRSTEQQNVQGSSANPLFKIKNPHLPRMTEASKQELEIEHIHKEKLKSENRTQPMRHSSSTPFIRHRKRKSCLHQYLEGTQFFDFVKNEVTKENVSYSGALALCAPPSKTVNDNELTIKPMNLSVKLLPKKNSFSTDLRIAPRKKIRPKVVPNRFMSVYYKKPKQKSNAKSKPKCVLAVKKEKVEGWRSHT